MTAVVTDYQSLMAALHSRIDELAISHDLVDELAGWAKGYAGKILGGSQVKTLGLVNLWILLGTLGLRFVVENDPAQVARMERRWERRVDKYRRPDNTARELNVRAVRRIAKQFGKVGGMARMAKLSRKKRKELGRLGGKASGAVRRRTKPLVHNSVPP